MEITEQQTVIAWLQVHKIVHTANVPDRKFCARAGYSKGVPDVLVFDVPEGYWKHRMFVGVAIEMKRRKGGVLSPEQKIWLAQLEARGWLTCVAHGADEAIAFLEKHGYGKR